jgi:hypothetical protein
MPYKDSAKMTEYQRLYRQHRRDDWFRKHGPCKICGSWRFLKLFSHTVRIPHSVWSLGDKKRNAILAECIALCGKHHRIESLQRFKRQQSEVADTYNEYKSLYFPSESGEKEDGQLSLF